jgi:D-amino peptidase
MNVIICTDLEGVSGVVSFDHQAAGNGRYYEAARHLLTAEVNAAVDALVEGGTEEILVVDGHGAGAMLIEELHPKATLLHGRGILGPRVREVVMPRFQLTMMIGQHAMVGTPYGTLNHTQDHLRVAEYRLNGQPIGEIAQWGLFAGAYGIPLVFLSGDTEACREATALVPGITTVAVKEGIGREIAISLPPVTAQERIREGVRKALQRQKRKPLPPLRWKGPFVLEKRFVHNDVADHYANHPHATVLDACRVRLEFDNILDIIYA